MKNNFLLHDEFIQWLVDFANLPLPSAKSYCIYVSAADKYTKIKCVSSLIDSNLIKILDDLVQNSNNVEVANVIDSVIAFLSLNNITELLDSSSKYISNWKSGLFQYKDFLNDYIDANIDSITDDVSSVPFSYLVSPSCNNKKHNSDVVSSKIEKAKKNTVTMSFGFDTANKIYSTDDIYSNFTFRIITQDRYYDEIFYPISFIKRYFYYTGGKAYFDNWVKELLDNVNVHHTDGSIKLQHISNLEIINNKVSASFNNISLSLFTKESDNISLSPLIVSDLSKIALDHEKPLYNIMNENIEQFITFKEITNELKKHIHGKTNIKKLKKAYNITLFSNYINEINLEGLKADLKLVSSLTKLQLMESSRNSSKGTLDLV